MLSSRGGIMCDLTVTRLSDDAFLVVTGGAVGKHDLAWMRRHLPGDGSVHLDDQTSRSCCIAAEPLFDPTMARLRDVAPVAAR